MEDSFDEESWGMVVKTATERFVAVAGTAVPGSRLRQEVAVVAAEHRMVFPPLAFANYRFGDFVRHFAGKGVIAIKERDGQDLLVVPVSMEHLFEKPISAVVRTQTGIRPDFFDAFTKASQNKVAWYDKEGDRIDWFLAGISMGPAWTRIPSVSLADALEDRAVFCDEVRDRDPERVSTLEATLVSKDLDAVSKFADAIRVTGLQQDWFRFRFKLVTGRMEVWAGAEGIPWNPSWHTTGSRVGAAQSSSVPYEAPPPSKEGGTITPTNQGGAPPPREEWRESLGYFISRLDQSDLARISVPLDIVAKIVQQSR